MCAEEPPDLRRCIPVRLTEIDEQVRLHAARQAGAKEADPDEKLSLLYAALFPSDRIYWVAP